MYPPVARTARDRTRWLYNISFASAWQWVEVSCSNGIFADGEERWVAGECKSSSKAACDDSTSCTTDVAIEVGGGLCQWVPDNSTKCRLCQSGSTCVPSCSLNGTPLSCGANGCGGSCGSCSDAAPICSHGTCGAPRDLGACLNPIPLVGGSGIPQPYTQYAVSADLATGRDDFSPSCSSNKGLKELFFSFELQETTGFDIRTLAPDGTDSGVDTVIEVMTINSTTAMCSKIMSPISYCNDDQWGSGLWYTSQVTGKLPAGKYVVIVEFYDGRPGPFSLMARFRPDDCIPRCGAQLPPRKCGPDGCPGINGTCFQSPPLASNIIAPGDCARQTPAKVCSVDGVCVTSAQGCVPNCKGKVCGSDGCNSTCGECRDGYGCNLLKGSCVRMAPCNPLKPVCKKCSSKQFCGSDCQCHKLSEQACDLTISQAHMRNTLSVGHQSFASTSCALDEGCLGGSGLRKLLFFAISTYNTGLADFIAPPAAQNPALFSWHTCHGHW